MKYIYIYISYFYHNNFYFLLTNLSIAHSIDFILKKITLIARSIDHCYNFIKFLNFIKESILYLSA